MLNGFDISLVAVKPALLAANKNIVDVLVRIQAPDAPKNGLPERPPLNLAIVIDRSGSMDGKPLYEAKRAAGGMVDSLKPTDRACVVAYDDNVKVIAQSQPVENKLPFIIAIQAIESGGSTNLHGGWLAGADEVAPHIASNVISRVLLLSDGNANNGLTQTDEIANQCAGLAETGVTTSTYGLGHHFNEDLMQAMASSGCGNAYYSETGESLMERFREEFSLLSALCARNVHLSLTPVSGASIEVLNPYEIVNANCWRLPDLAYDGECWAVVRVSLDAENAPTDEETLALLQASVTYNELDGKQHELPEVWLTLPFVDGITYDGIQADEKIYARIIEADAARLQERARTAARNGDWYTVKTLLQEVRKMAEHSPWLNQIVKTLEELAAREDYIAFSKQAQYSARGLSGRMRSKKEFDTDFNEDSMPLYLQKKIHHGRTGHFGSGFAKTKMDCFLEQFDNYPVAVIDGKRILLDTGSPFSIGNGATLDILGQRFTPGSALGMTTDKLSMWMKTEIDALLGCDILSQFVVSIDWWQSTLTFAARGTSFAGTELSAELLMGTPVLEFGSPNGRTRGIFDTGAKLCYVPWNATTNKTPINHTHDFLPGFGTFESDVYELQFEFARHSFLANCGILPDSAAKMLHGMTGIEWVIGTDLLRQGIIGIDLDIGRITAEWK
jgi:Ca-activated chloride channel family protein